MRTSTTKAFVLRMIPYRDADMVCTLLTRTEGKISAMARGARRSKRRFGGALDYFCLVEAELRPSKSGMASLTSVNLISSYSRITEDVERFTAASHIVEVSRLASKEGDPSPQPFDLLQASLEALQGGGDPKSLVRIFQIKTVAHLGYALAGGHCTGCGGPIGDGETHLSDLSLVCSSCAPRMSKTITQGAVKTLEAAQRIPYSRMSTLSITPTLDQQLGPLVQNALTRALGATPNSLDIF